MRRLLVAAIAVLLLIPIPTTSATAPTPIKPYSASLFNEVKISEPPYVFPQKREIPTKPELPKFEPQVKSIKNLTLQSTESYSWVSDPEVSWYGPGFYGNRTACGLAYTTSIIGVAHRTLPCGTLVDFRFKGKTIRVPVIDRGPYVAGREWDLSGGLCVALDHCFTGPIEYRIVK